MSAECSSTCATRDAVQTAFQAIKQAVTREGWRGAFPGRDGAADGRGCDGYELILGSSIDAQFGPVLLFGTGGQLVEVFKDRALALPPLNTTLARRLMEQTKIFTALQGRSRTQAGGSGGAGGAAGAVQPAGHRAAAGSRRSISIRCWRRRSDCWRWMRAWWCTVPEMTRGQAAGRGNPSVSDSPGMYALEDEGRASR